MSFHQKAPDAAALVDEELQYGHGPLTEAELYDKYPKKPRNHSKTFAFHELFQDLFDPLNSQKKQTGPKVARAKKGPHGPVVQTPTQIRDTIIDRFISRWRKEVGNDFYPALRLILPDKDRDRPMYGLKEKNIGKLIVKILKINPNSEDGNNLLNWKLPGQTTASRMAGDFAGRCYEVLSKRAMRNSVGDMRIAEVNYYLDKLAAVSKEEDQLPIFETFYNRMNADELQWLIRIILRQMKIGSSENTFFTRWHPDGVAIFNVSSSLRRVCWELVDSNDRLESEKAGITLMECFQPQLAQFQLHSFQRMVEKLGCTEDNPEFWIEEKLDGERMQLHMVEDDDVPGGRRFAFWSRKGKDYTYLYGNGFEDDSSSLTRFLKDGFNSKVKNIILDGEMITWDPQTDTMVGFGTLKSAALSEQRNPFDTTGHRPLFRVFDCLYLNDENLTRYMLRDRRHALEEAVNHVERRMEIHKYQVATDFGEIEPALRRVVAEASEGLVLKNPRSMYQLNARKDDWQKVKPEYMIEFGENLDCVVIGGYYGQGHRGGRLASFLCGLRVNDNHIRRGANPMKCYSFFKVGGGFRADDFAKIKHHTDGKWIDWDAKNPPTEFIQLGGGDRQYERPDQWIKPCDSVVLEVKAASVGSSDQFGTNYTLRFPRFKRIRDDKTWEQALSIYEFQELKAKVDAESKDKEFKLDTSRRVSKRLKKELTIAGNETKVNAYAGSKTAVFGGLNFCVLSEMLKPQKKSKVEIEQVIKSNGGRIFQSATAADDMICIGDKKVVKAASLIKSGHTNIVKASWVFDAIKQSEIDGTKRSRLIVPFEPSHMFHMTEESKGAVEDAVDVYGDSYARDLTVEDLKLLMDDMIHPKDSTFSGDDFLAELEERGKGANDLPGSMFRRCVLCFVDSSSPDLGKNIDIQISKSHVLFGGGKVVDDDDNESITHFVVVGEDSQLVKSLRRKISSRGKLPRIVQMRWLSDSWDEKTLLDEEGYVITT